MEDKREEILLIGHGGHASVLLDLLFKSNRKVLGYFDRVSHNPNPFKVDYLGDERNAEDRVVLESYPYLVGIGDNNRRKQIVAWADSLDFRLASPAIHVHAYVASNTQIGEGTMVGVHATVNPGAYVGRAAILNTASIVEHDSWIGDYCHIAPGAIVLGGAWIGAGSLLGSGAVVLPGVRVGQDVVVGAGAVVTRDVEAGRTIAGVPAR